jgi:hypothetical protein
MTTEPLAVGHRQRLIYDPPIARSGIAPYPRLVAEPARSIVVAPHVPSPYLVGASESSTSVYGETFFNTLLAR